MRIEDQPQANVLAADEPGQPLGHLLATVNGVDGLLPDGRPDRRHRVQMREAERKVQHAGRRQGHSVALNRRLDQHQARLRTCRHELAFGRDDHEDAVRCKVNVIRENMKVIIGSQ